MYTLAGLPWKILGQQDSHTIVAATIAPSLPLPDIHSILEAMDCDIQPDLY